MNAHDWQELQEWLDKVAEEAAGWADRIDPERNWKGGSVRPMLDQVARSSRHASTLVAGGARS